MDGLDAKEEKDEGCTEKQVKHDSVSIHDMVLKNTWTPSSFGR